MPGSLRNRQMCLGVFCNMSLGVVLDLIVQLLSLVHVHEGVARVLLDKKSSCWLLSCAEHVFLNHSGTAVLYIARALHAAYVCEQTRSAYR